MKNALTLHSNDQRDLKQAHEDGADLSVPVPVVSVLWFPAETHAEAIIALMEAGYFCAWECPSTRRDDGPVFATKKGKVDAAFLAAARETLERLARRFYGRYLYWHVCPSYFEELSAEELSLMSVLIPSAA